MANFNPDHKAILDDMLLGHPLARPGKMFGFPAYYAGKKPCMCLYEEGVGIKLPAASVAKLLAEDARMGADQRAPLRRLPAVYGRF